MRTTQRKPAIVFPLATNAQRFGNGEPDTTLASDYCFTGSHWRLPREIETNLQPDRLGDYKFSLFGRGWEGHPTLGDFAHGFVPYEKIPAIYASTRVVIDDANHVTKGWASVNSRVFDALAAGALVVTNGAAGANEFFDGELPVYQTPDELQSLLKNYLGNEVERRRLTDRLRTKVLQQHTYRHRARRLKAILLGRARSCYRIAIKIGAPTRSESRHWGDYHFALSLGRCLAAAGHSYRIDCLDEWERPESFGDDVVLVLRGLSRYQPRCGQINLMWNISHPDKVSLEEYKEFDHVFIASQTHAAELAGKVTVPVSPLLQCSDPFVFYPDPNPAVPYEELLFVGNSRKQYREVVRCAVEANLPLAVYGTFWSRFIGSQYLRGSYVENSILRQYYSRCSILLNDHWPSMRHSGFLSNRLFDAAAAGAFVISDRVQEAESIFGEDLVTYGNSEDFLALIDHYLRHPEERRARAERLREKVLARHTFTHRAEMILSQIRALDSEKRAPERLRNQRSDSSQEKPGLKPLSCRLAPAKATLRLAERE
ncbi:MAG: glycosyltransferase family protein [Chthoniobacterales bacterium]